MKLQEDAMETIEKSLEIRLGNIARVDDLQLFIPGYRVFVEVNNYRKL